MSAQVAAAATAAAGSAGEGRPLQVVITGGSRGIGKACVQAFASRGHRVLFTYRTSEAEAAAVVDDARWKGRVRAVKLDQGNFAYVQVFASTVQAWRGDRPLDAVIHNAALGSATVETYRARGGEASPASSPTAAGAESERARQDEALMRVNALGPLWLTQALLPMMGGGTAAAGEPPVGRSVMLYLGSVGGASQSVFPGFRPADAMSKAAVGYMVKLLAAEHSHSPVDFICISPGAVLTDMFKASTLDRMSPEERAAFIARLPKGRLIEPAEIADTLYWLATSPCARVFNGACLDASQGLAVRPGLITERHA